MARASKGRPSKFTKEIADLICVELPYCDGGLEELCNKIKTLPSARTVYRWLSDPDPDPDKIAFRQNYAHARLLVGDVQFDRALRDALKVKDAQKARLIWDARRFHAAQLNAKKYGKRPVELGVNPDNPLLSILERISGKTLTPSKAKLDPEDAD